MSSDSGPTRLGGPATVLTLDLEDVPDLPGTDRRYAVVLLRRALRPFAEVVVPMGPDGLRAPQLRAAIDRELAAQGIGVPAHHAMKQGEGQGLDVEISVVLTTCAISDELMRAIDSVLASRGATVDVIVVDNRPDTSGAQDAVRERYAGDPRVRAIAERRPGLSYARNAGIAVARTDIVAWTDDDVVVDPYWARFLVEAFALAPDVDLVTGLIRPLELATQAQIWRETHRGYARGFNRRVYRADPPPPDAPLFPYATGRIGSGANMAVRRIAMERLGGFDVTLGAGTPAAGGEDLDLVFRFLVSGSVVVFEPAAIVSHDHHREFAALIDQARDYGTGLASYLMTLITSDPRRLADIARRSPAAAAHLRSLRRGPQVEGRTVTDPTFSRRLRRAEARGMAIGVRRATAQRLRAPRARKRRSGR